ncbi:CFEM domain-containing protein [Colletotrichum graminicola M1.001]|uniref:CFEM domain-containing protein n=1 Tax=Colletotrichum graminicola (strain M1.001 / M2 / FGSC 10212) TaxID=645133 RepID=E3QXZ2_COLGM|nr:CFEM domain-containing protein [Colletotrichum graminicola M1.001]EFQ35730.1 CFEM domain-containing protein [Colletotrichum graminicola M1.001]
MRLLHNSLFLVIICTATATLLPEPRAGASTTALLEDLPKCSLPCFNGLLQTARCGSKSFGGCVCSDMRLQSQVSTCVQTSCIFEEQVLTSRISQEFCHGYPIPEHRRNVCRVFLVVLPAITAIVVVLRFISRRIGRIQLWWDDWTALIALLSLIITLGCAVASVELGFGLHFWHVKPGNSKPILQLFYIMQIFYLVKHIAAKISICAMYLRILVDRWSRIAVIGLIASLIVQTILFFFLVAFQCTPVQSIWDRSVPGFCLNIQAISYAGAAFTITYDCIFIVLPLPQLLKLNIPMRKKLALALLLTLGSVLPALRPLLSKVKETMRSYAHRGHKRSAAECEDVAECEDQTKLSDLGQYQASDKSYVLPDSPRRLDEPRQRHLTADANNSLLLQKMQLFLRATVNLQRSQELTFSYPTLLSEMVRRMSN